MEKRRRVRKDCHETNTETKRRRDKPSALLIRAFVPAIALVTRVEDLSMSSSSPSNSLEEGIFRSDSRDQERVQERYERVSCLDFD